MDKGKRAGRPLSILTAEEHVGFDDGVDEGFETGVGFGFLKDFFERRSISEGERAAGGIDEKLLSQGAVDEIFVLEQDLAELFEGFKGGPVFKGAVLLDVGAFGVRFALGDFFALTEGAIPATFAADGIEDLEGKAGRIDVIVTACARFVGAVFCELVADGDGAPDIGLDRRDAGRGWRDRPGEDLIENPNATEDG